MTAGTLITILATGWSIALLLAAWWAWGSVRSWWFSRGGKRAGTPYCRACSFDLTGLTRDDTTPAKRCPECGAEIDRAGAVLIGGAARNKPGLKWLALALAIVTSVFVVISAIYKPPVAWVKHLPDWMLQQSATVTHDPETEIVLGELLGRWGIGPSMRRWLIGWQVLGTGTDGAVTRAALVKRSGDDILRLARVGLARQADPARPWVEAWGDVIELALLLDLLSVDERARYKAGMVDLSFRYRSKIRVGTEMPIDFVVSSIRTRRSLSLDIAQPRLASDGEPAIGRILSSTNPLSDGTSFRSHLGATRSLAPGIHSLDVLASVRVVAKDLDDVMKPFSPRRWTARVEAVAADEPISTAVRGAEIDRTMANLLKDVSVELIPSEATRGRRSLRLNARSGLLSVALRFSVASPPPIPLAARIELYDWEKPSGTPLAIGPIVIDRSGSRTVFFNTELSDLSVRKELQKPWVGIRFVAEEKVADISLSADRYWGGVVDFPKVPLYCVGIPEIPDRAPPK